MSGFLYFAFFTCCVFWWSCDALRTWPRMFEDRGYRKNDSSYDAHPTVICSRWNTSDGTTMEGLLVFGQNIMLGDFVDLYNYYSFGLRNYCDIDRTNGSFLVILATNSFIIDQDFEEVNLNMVVIAPLWIVFDERRISLDGSSETIKPSYWSTKSICYSNPGYSGEVGKPGHTGGSFLGIGEHFFNGINLTITANGGDGSPGGGGGNGGDGRKGEYSSTLDEQSVNCKSANHCIQAGYIRSQDKILGYEMWFNCSGKISKDACTIEIHGRRGIVGGDGGAAGCGGPGGHPGIMEMIDLSRVSGILTENRPGIPGANGTGGPGGKGGVTGDTLVYSITEKKGKVIDSQWEWKSSKEINKRGSNGTLKPESVFNPYLPRKNWFGLIEAERVVREYRQLLMRSFSNPDAFQKKYVSGFYSRVDSSTYKTRCSMFTIGQLMDNLRELEEDYHKFNKPEEFLVLYETLLDKIRIHSEPPCSGVWTEAIASKTGMDQKTWETRVRPEQEKMLRFLYTATLGRLYSMKDHASSVVITDIGEYLNSVQQIIQELNEVKGERNKFLLVLSKLNTVKQYKAEYGKYIGHKLEEVNMLITKQILPEIDQINKDTMANIDELLNEIEERKRAVERNIEELKEREDKLREAMYVNAFFGVFRVIGLALNFIPVVGPILGAGAQVLCTAAEIAYNSYSDDTLPEFSQLTSDYDEFKTVYNNYTKQGSKIANVKKRPEKQKPSKEMVKMTKGLALGAGQVVRKYQGDKSKLEEVQEQIEKGKEELEKIKVFENNIRVNFKTSLSKMGDSMKSAADALQGRSHAALDVTKWQIVGSLKNVMGRVKAVTTGFKVQEKMMNCIEKMQDTMKTLVELFDQIQNHQEQLNLANFIADVSAASATDVNVTNPEFLNITHHLQLMIASNLVIQKYQEAVNAFKQFVFPFAHLYFDDLLLPASISARDSLEDLVSTAAIQVDHLVKRLNDYKQTIKKQDEIIGVGKFDSKYKSTRPFYVWKNTNHKDLISKLFSCEEIVLVADVRKSRKREDAVKFNLIQFSFKVTDKYKHMQSKLDDVLKKFEVMATHMGTSYYRYENKTFMVMTNSLHFWYNIETDKDGKPVRRDVSYDKVTRGDYSLSPYAVWKLELSDLSDDVTCADLKQYADKVDVELVGEANYVKTGKRNKLQLEVDTYYKSFDTDQLDKLDLGNIDEKNAYDELVKRVLKQRDLYFKYWGDGFEKMGMERIKKFEYEREQAIKKHTEPVILNNERCDAQ